jgi:hypothetical protein
MEEAWSVPDVYLLAESGQGEVAIPGLTLTFLESGLALDKADGEPVWHSNWADLKELSVVERSVLPDGRDGVLIVVVERAHGRRHRFALGSDDPAATESATRRRARSHGVRTLSGRRAVSRVLTVCVAMAAPATLTVLLLSAAHVIHF